MCYKGKVYSNSCTAGCEGATAADMTDLADDELSITTGAACDSGSDETKDTTADDTKTKANDEKDSGAETDVDDSHSSDGDMQTGERERDNGNTASSTSETAGETESGSPRATSYELATSSAFIVSVVLIALKI